MLLYCLAVNVPLVANERAVQALATMVQVYPQLDSGTVWSQQLGKHFVAGVHNPPGTLGRRRYVYTAPDHVTFFEGTLVDPRGRFVGSDSSEVDRFWDEIPAVAEGQYVAVRVSETAVEVITDPVGMEQVYYARLDGGWVVANSVTLLARIIGRQPMDTRAASFFLCQSWVAEDRTLSEGIRVIPGGQHWTWRQGKSAPDTREYFGIRNLADHRGLALGDLTSALTAQVQALSRSTGLLECPITAGKDSRLLTALVLQTGAKATFFTAGASTTLDVMAGQAIARSLGIAHEIRSYTSSDLTAAWESTSRKLLEQTDGLVSLWYLDNFLDQPEQIQALTMQLWGIGGEIARGYWNDPKVVLRVRSARGYLAAKVAASHGGLVRPEAHALATDIVNRFVRDAREAGCTATELPDVFEARQSVPRGDGSRGRNSRSTGDYFSPFCTRPWLIAAFGLTPAQRMTEPLHYRLLRRLRPELHSPPLGTPWRPQGPLQNLASMITLSASGRVRRRLWPTPLTGPVHHRTMLETKLGEVRARCLDRAQSSLWKLVSRHRFEQMTAPDASVRQRGRHIHGLYNVITLFEYEALAGG